MSEFKTKKLDAYEEFLASYIERGFGTVNKRESDRLVFKLLVDSGKIENLDDYHAVSRFLKLTPTRAANLAYEYKLLTKPPMTYAELREQFGQLLRNTYLGRAHGRAALEVRDRLLREEIEQQIQRLKLGAADYSFNSNLLLLDYPTLAALVVDFAGEETLTRLENELKKSKDLPRDLPSGRDLFAMFIEHAAAKAGEKSGEKIIDIADIVLTGGITSLISTFKQAFKSITRVAR